MPALKAGLFYERVNATLIRIKFAEQVHAACAEFYTSRLDGRPPIDPVVFFKRNRCAEPLLTGSIIDVVGRSYDLYEFYAASGSGSMGAVSTLT